MKNTLAISITAAFCLAATSAAYAQDRAPASQLPSLGGDKIHPVIKRPLPGYFPSETGGSSNDLVQTKSAGGHAATSTLPSLTGDEIHPVIKRPRRGFFPSETGGSSND